MTVYTWIDRNNVRLYLTEDGSLFADDPKWKYPPKELKGYEIVEDMPDRAIILNYEARYGCEFEGRCK